MLSSMRVDLGMFSKNWGLFFAWGILLMLVGFFAIGADVFTTMVTMVFLGIALTVGGAIILLDAFTFWRKSAGNFILHILLGALYIAAGWILIKNPVEGSLSLTFILGIFYLVVGIFRTFYAISSKAPHWGWGLVNGLLSLLLGALILLSWPTSGLYIIGLFVGIDLVFCGWVYMMGALTARSLGK